VPEVPLEDKKYDLTQHFVDFPATVRIPGRTPPDCDVTTFECKVKIAGLQNSGSSKGKEKATAASNLPPWRGLQTHNKQLAVWADKKEAKYQSPKSTGLVIASSMNVHGYVLSSFCYEHSPFCVSTSCTLGCSACTVPYIKFPCRMTKLED